MRDMGDAVLGTGVARGEHRAVEAALIPTIPTGSLIPSTPSTLNSWGNVCRIT